MIDTFLEANRNIILQTDIFTQIVSRASGDLLWNPYSATILRQLVEQGIASLFTVKFAHALKDEIRKKLLAKDISNTLFEAIGNQPFALDVFVPLVGYSEVATACTYALQLISSSGKGRKK